jgi:putative addiction module CopG family antidote
MVLSLPAEMQSFVQSKVDSGEFADADEVMRAALSLLMIQSRDGDFAPGEIDALLDEADESIERDGTVPADEFFREMDEVAKEFRSRPR